jgi:ferrous iron transport protein B
MNAELKSKKWLFAGIGMQLGVGYTLGFLVYFFGTLFSGAHFGKAWMPILGWGIVLALAVLVVLLILSRKREDAKNASKPREVARV